MVSKHLVDIEEEALSAARAQLHAEHRNAAITKSLDNLAKADLADRADAWR